MDTIKTQFDLHTRLFNNVLDGVSDEEADSRANDQVNHLKWLAGHLLMTRMGMAKMSGMPADTSMDEYFAHGTPIDSSKNYPSLAVIKEKWEPLSAAIRASLDNIPSEMLAGDAPFQLPVADQTMKGYLGFLMHHEAYHIGQMGILRKYIGNDAMKYS